MSNFDDSAPVSGEKTSSSSLRRLLTSGTTTTPVTYQDKRARLNQYILPLVLVLALVVGVAILAYSFGVSRGKSSANSERDKFYESRASSWSATASAQSGAGITAAAGNTGGGFSQANSIYARVDSLDGARVTVLLLNGTGAPTGTSLDVTVTKQTRIWRSVPNQAVDLKAGDTILLTGERKENGNYEAGTILVLPPST